MVRRTEFLLVGALLVGLAAARPPVQVAGPPSGMGGPPVDVPSIPDVADPAVNISEVRFYGFAGNLSPPGRFAWKDNRTKARKEVRKEIENAERSIVQLERFYENMKDLSSRLPAREQAVLRQQLADVNRTLNRSGRLLAEARERFASGAYEAAWRKAVRVQDRVGEARLRLERDRERLRSNLSQGLEKRIERLERRVERLNRTVNRLERNERVPPVAVRRVRNNLREAREALAAARRQERRVRNASTSVEAVRMSSSVVERLERTSQNMRDAERVIETVRSPWYARPGFMWTALVVGAVLAVGGFLYYRFGDWWNGDENDDGETGEDAVEDEERN